MRRVTVGLVLCLMATASAADVHSVYWNTGQPPMTAGPGGYVERWVAYTPAAEDVGRPIIGWLLNVIAEPIGAPQSILAQLLNGPDANYEITFVRTATTGSQIIFLPAGAGIPMAPTMNLEVRCWNQSPTVTTTCRASVRVYYLD